jgi:hypothetical protein
MKEDRAVRVLELSRSDGTKVSLRVYLVRDQSSRHHRARLTSNYRIILAEDPTELIRGGITDVLCWDFGEFPLIDVPAGVDKSGKLLGQLMVVNLGSAGDSAEVRGVIPREDVLALVTAREQ